VGFCSSSPDRLRCASRIFENEILVLFDSLGAQLVTDTDHPGADALHETWPAASQVRSMPPRRLWGHRYLIEGGYLDG
jgi:hypothetical protein